MLKQEWVDHSLALAAQPASFYSGARKIHTGRMIQFSGIDDSLRIEDAGFTKTKLSMLRRLYWSDEHASAVAELWRGRLARNKYGSVSVSTYHHLTKADPTKRSKRASVMGPCLVGVSLTLLSDGVGVDAFYRTTEFLKKWVADAVFIRDVVLPAMGVAPSEVCHFRCHFANLTMHTMYWSTIVPHLDDPVAEWEKLKRADRRFWEWSIKWQGRYLCDEYAHGIQKFSQALRVRKDALERTRPAVVKRLQQYIRDNHPGYRGADAIADDEED